jgi:hypothetical protein
MPALLNILYAYSKGGPTVATRQAEPTKTLHHRS